MLFSSTARSSRGCRRDASGVDADALKRTAKLFRRFAEDYHERQLEEQHIFEKKTFGHDGFEEAEKTIAAIEKTLGLADLGIFTAPPPPKA